MATGVDLSKKKRSRGGFKAAISNSFNKFDSCRAADKIDLIMLKTILMNISDYLDKIQIKENEIFELFDNDVDYNDFMLECEDYSLKTKVKFEKYKSVYELLLDSNSATGTPSSADKASKSNSNFTCESFKLDR